MATRWITRHGRTPRTFRYRHPDGRPVADARTLERLRALAVPPAWTDVHLAASASAEVQAWGFDAAGRKQYRYHERAVERGTRRKYYRVRALGHDLPRIRQAVDRALRARTPTRERAAAVVVRLLEEGFFRIGSERYARENRTFGMATLQKRHLTIEGDLLRFRYTGKRGKRQAQTVVDRRLARLVARTYAKTPGRRLFRYEDDDGWHDLTARDVNAFLRETLEVPYTAKDFRTWGGTLRAAVVLADIGAEASTTAARRTANLTLRLVAAELGNTPAICRASYVHPLVLGRYVDDGETITIGRGSRDRRRHMPEERALLRFLDEHFPERRKRRKTRVRKERREG